MQMKTNFVSWSCENPPTPTSNSNSTKILLRPSDERVDLSYFTSITDPIT